MIIPTKNNERTIRKLLNSIIKASGNNDIEILIIDSLSDDKTTEIAREYGCDVVEVDCGRSQGRNIGAARSTSNVMIFLDSDMEIPPTFISESLDMVDKYDCIIYKEFSKGNNITAIVRKFERIGFFGLLYPESPRCIKKDLFMNVGGFDESMSGLEDLDLTSRLIQSNALFGWSLNTYIIHHEQDVGFLQYLSKREFYSNYIPKFKSMNPEYYAKLKSFRIRFQAICKSIKNYGILFSFLILPLFIIQRLIEYANLKLSRLK